MNKSNNKLPSGCWLTKDATGVRGGEGGGREGVVGWKGGGEVHTLTHWRNDEGMKRVRNFGGIFSYYFFVVLSVSIRIDWTRPPSLEEPEEPVSQFKVQTNNPHTTNPHPPIFFVLSNFFIIYFLLNFLFEFSAFKIIPQSASDDRSRRNWNLNEKLDDFFSLTKKMSSSRFRCFQRMNY